MSGRDQPYVWQLGHGRSITLDRPRIMGILNVTPDSFSDGGQFDRVDRALARAREMIEQGADCIDIGGESTRPGAQRIDAAEQIRRVAPVIRAIREAGIETPISVDTTLAEVALRAIDAGADCVNDVSAGTEDDAMLALVARTGSGLVLMHRRSPPNADVYSHQHAQPPEYASEGGVVEAVLRFLQERVATAVELGLNTVKLVVDPGLGFGKDVDQNFEISRSMSRFATLGVPVLSACSRKSFLGAATGIREASDRVAPTLAMSLCHASMGIRLFRVHDVMEHARAFAIWSRLGFSG